MLYTKTSGGLQAVGSSSGTIYVRGDATDAQIRAIFDGLAAGDRVIFTGSSYSITLPLTVAVANVTVDATCATITMTTSGKPVFDVLYGADDVQIHWRKVIGTNNRYAGYEAGASPGWNAAGDVTFRGERISNYSAGVYTNAQRGDFKGQVDGFYVGGYATSWNPNISAMDPDGTYRQGNRFDLDVNNVDFGLGYCGQEALHFEMRGAHSIAPGSPHVPHLVYGLTTRKSRGVTGNGSSHPGSDHAASGAWKTVAIANATGGTYTLTAGGNTTSALAYNATKSTVQSALQALGSVGSNKAWVYGSPTLFDIVFDYTLGDISFSADGASLTGSGPTATAASLANGGNGWAFQFKDQEDACFGILEAKECAGAVLFTDGCVNCHVATAISSDDYLATTGSVFVDTDCTNVTFGEVKIAAIASFPTRTTKSVALRGTGCGIGRLTLTETFNTADSSSNAVDLIGTSCFIDKVIYRNAGTGGRSVVKLDGSGNRVTIEEAKNVFRPVWIASGSASTNNSVRVHPRNVSWTGTGTRFVQDDRTGSLTHDDSFGIISPYRPTLTTVRVEATAPHWQIGLSASNQTISNPHAPFRGATLLLELNNATGGVSGTLTWDTQFVLSSLSSVPASTRQYIMFAWDSSASKWRELWRAP